MSFFTKVFNQSKKGFGKAILFGFILGLIFALSMLVTLKRGFNEEKLNKVIDETGCEIIDYQLKCDVEKYEKLDGVLIDLNYDDEAGDSDESIILSREDVFITGTSYSYKELLDVFSAGPDFDIDDLFQIVNSYFIILFVFFFIGGGIFYLLANLILGLVMMALINSVMKTRFKFDQMYKLTIYTSLPYVLLNGITRALFNFTLSNLIPMFLGSFIIDYLIIFAITYFVVKKGYEPEEKPEIELPFEA